MCSRWSKHYIVFDSPRLQAYIPHPLSRWSQGRKPFVQSWSRRWKLNDNHGFARDGWVFTQVLNTQASRQADRTSSACRTKSHALNAESAIWPRDQRWQPHVHILTPWSTQRSTEKIQTMSFFPRHTSASLQETAQWRSPMDNALPVSYR